MTLPFFWTARVWHLHFPDLGKGLTTVRKEHEADVDQRAVAVLDYEYAPFRKFNLLLADFIKSAKKQFLIGLLCKLALGRASHQNKQLRLTAPGATRKGSSPTKSDKDCAERLPARSYENVASGQRS